MTTDTGIATTMFSPLSFEVVDVRLIGSASLVQTRPRQPGTRGFRNTLRLGEGMFASWALVDRDLAAEERYDSNGNMKINLRLEGQSTISGGGNRHFDITPPMCSALLQPRGETKLERFRAGTHEQSVTISCTREHLTGELSLLPERFDGALGSFLSGEPFDFTLLRSDFTLEMKLAAKAFFEPAADKAVHRLHLLSRAHDIVRLFFEWQGVQGGAARFRPAELTLIEKVKTLVAANLEEIPATADLAAAVGTSASRLMRLFKSIE